MSKDASDFQITDASNTPISIQPMGPEDKQTDKAMSILESIPTKCLTNQRTNQIDWRTNGSTDELIFMERVHASKQERGEKGEKSFLQGPIGPS